MPDNISTYIFLSVVMIALGYAAGNTKQLNFWKLLLFGLVLFPFLDAFGVGGERSIQVMVVSFIFGFFLPFASAFSGLFDFIPRLIDRIRYQTKSQPENQAEQPTQEAHKEQEQKSNADYQRRKEEARERRRERAQSKSEQSTKGRGQRRGPNQSSRSSGPQNSTTTQEQKRRAHLNVLGLDPDVKPYSFDEIKKAYLRQMNTYHTDKNPGVSSETKQRLDKKCQEVAEAFEALS